MDIKTLDAKRLIELEESIYNHNGLNNLTEVEIYCMNLARKIPLCDFLEEREAYLKSWFLTDEIKYIERLMEKYSCTKEEFFDRCYTANKIRRYKEKKTLSVLKDKEKLNILFSPADSKNVMETMVKLSSVETIIEEPSASEYHIAVSHFGTFAEKIIEAREAQTTSLLNIISIEEQKGGQYCKEKNSTKKQQRRKNMNKDYYTLKEIVFGLRKEQLRVIEKLRELEKYVNILDGSKCKSVQLSITSIKELSYSCLVKYDNLLKRILDFVSGDFVEAIMGGYYVGFGQVKNDNNGKYIFHGGVTVKDEDQEAFGIKVKELLSDEFVQNMDYSIKFYENECSASSLSLDHDSILYRGSVDLDNYDTERMFYNGKYDVLCVDNVLNKKYKEFMKEMLNLKIPRKLISEYLQTIIDGNDDTKKDIIIPNTIIHTKSTWFNIKEEPNAFVLVKKRIPTIK